MQIKDRIKGMVQVDWTRLKDLQPCNAKLPQNGEWLRESVEKHGFTIPFAVWLHKGQYYCVDGHTRKDLLMNMKGEGADVPQMLSAYEIDAANKKEAIKILLECHNIKHNPFDKAVLLEMLEAEEIEVEEINLESIYMAKPKGFEDDDEDLPEEQTFIPTFKLEIICKTEKEQHKIFNKLSEEGYEIRFPD